jgi:hypothetical protein
VTETLERRSAAVYYLPRSGTDQETTAALAARAGLEDPHEPEWEGHAGHVFGRWGGMDGSYAWVEELPDHRALAVVFWQRLFFEAMRAEGDDSLDESALPEPVRAFVAACRTLDPVAAFVTSRRHQVAPEFIRDLGRLAAGLDGYGFLDERLALLYLGPDATSLVAEGALRGRDHLRVDGGLVVFAATGPERWL